MDTKREYEIVIQDKNIPMSELKERIKSLGGEIIQEESIFYHFKYLHPYNNNKAFIRLRNEVDKITLTYKIHDGKFPREHEIIVNNFKEAHDILKLLGCQYDYECHKLREIWSLKGCKEIVFDTYPGVETYAELECDNEKDIKLVLEKLKLNTNFDEYERISINKYYQEKYGIIVKSKNKLTFKTAYKLLNQTKKNRDIFKQRLDEVNEKHKLQILDLEKKRYKSYRKNKGSY